LVRAHKILPGGILANAQPKGSDRVGDVLDQLLTKILKAHPGLVTQVVPHPAGDADLATFDEALQPGSDVHSIAKDIAVLDNDITDIDPDPKPHLPLIWLSLVSPLERLLNFDCAANKHQGHW
jgi:hypothetical protein